MIKHLENIKKGVLFYVYFFLIQTIYVATLDLNSDKFSSLSRSLALHVRSCSSRHSIRTDYILRGSTKKLSCILSSPLYNENQYGNL